MPAISSKTRTATSFALLPLVAALAATLGAGAASAASFNITNAQTGAQTLGSGSGQTGTVSAAGSLTVGGGTVAVTVTGNNATLTNLGTISQTGNGRVIRDNTGVSNLVVTNGSLTNSTATLIAADADVIQMNKSPASVTLNNYGQMISTNASAGGSQAVDFNAILSGSNVVNNFAGGLMMATEADAVRPGVNGVVNNAGTIRSVTTTGSSSDGVDAQNNSGFVVNNAATGKIIGARHGITGGAVDKTVTFVGTVSNAAGGVIQGNNGSGINIDGFNNKELVTVTNGGLIVGNGVTGDGDGIDVDGLVSVTNTGTIRSVNAFSLPADGIAFSEGLSVGGGTITNSGLIEGLVSAGNTNAKGIGITLTGNDITSGPNIGLREGIYGNAVVDNLAGGVIRGQNSSAIVAKGLASGFTVTINNAAGGTIQGGGTIDPAIQTGLDNDTVTNRGLIDGSSSGKAIDLGGGDNTLNILGGAAVVKGDISGGLGGHNVLTIAAGTGGSFVYGGSISNFASLEVQSGTVTLSGQNTYTGTTIVSGGTLVLDGTNRLAAASALDLNGGALQLLHAGGADGQTFASLSVTGDSTVDLGDSSITFNGLGAITAGKTLTIEDWLASGSPDYAFRVLGDQTHNAAFGGLLAETTIDGVRVYERFDGTWTDVTAVPEPTNVALMLAGLGLVGFAARRRKQG